MPLVVITPPAVEPVALADARLHCRASAFDDAYLTMCIQSARSHCEGVIQQALIQRTVEQAWDTFPASEVLLSAPAVSVASVSYTDTVGATQTLAANLYTLDNRGLESWLLPALDTGWPATEATVNAVRVQYVTGLAATAADVPAAIRAWLLLTIGFLYAQREAFDMTGKATAIPNRFTDSLLDPWRVYGA